MKTPSALAYVADFALTLAAFNAVEPSELSRTIFDYLQLQIIHSEKSENEAIDELPKQLGALYRAYWLEAQILGHGVHTIFGSLDHSPDQVAAGIEALRFFGFMEAAADVLEAELPEYRRRFAIFEKVPDREKDAYKAAFEAQEYDYYSRVSDRISDAVQIPDSGAEEGKDWDPIRDYVILRSNEFLSE